MNLIRSTLVVALLMVTIASVQATAVCNASVTATTPSTDFMDHGDGTVTHSRTGLMWQRCALGQAWSAGTCTGTATTVTWSNALKAARDSSTAGYSDWRLPNVKELRTIVEEKCYSPSVNEVIFPNTSASDFWSASAYAGNSSNAWFVNFGYRNASYGFNKSYAFQVRLVRAGQSFDTFDSLNSTPTPTIPGPPTGISAAVGDTQATVSFTAPVGSASVTGYTATCGGISATGSTSPITVTGLTNGTAYTCTVRATNAVGTSTASTPYRAIPVASQSIIFGAAPTLTVGGMGSVSANGGASGNAVTFSSSSPPVCTVSGNTVSAHTAGDCVVIANQAGNAAYSAATPVTQTITVGGAPAVVTLNFLPSWNLVGNSVNTPLDVASTFGDANKVSTLWKWLPATSKWAFYTPTLPDGGVGYAATKGYDPLTTIHGGEGFWVNALTAFSATLPVGTAVATASFQDQSDPAQNKLLTGWNLVATGDNPTPSALHQTLAAGTTPINLTSLWAWSSDVGGWYFYSPDLEVSGGLAAYNASKNYLDFGSMTLAPGMGFWVRKP